MFHMLSCFDIRPGFDSQECCQALYELAQHMEQQGLNKGVDPVGKRETDTILDTDNERHQQYFMLMHFEDKAQSDKAVDYIKSAQEPGSSIHKNAYARLTNLIFICWDDIES